MNTILAIVCLISPFIFFYFKASIAYGQDIDEILKRWKSAKIFAFCLYVFYILFIVAVGHKEIAGNEGSFSDSNFFLDDWIEYYIVPGIGFSLIILSRPASEVLVDYKIFYKVGLHEDAAFIFGWVTLLMLGFTLLFDWL